MILSLTKIKKSYQTDIYAYGLEESTVKLMRLAGFKETELMINASDDRIGRLMIWHHY